jgi:hypothetical protein
MARAVVESDREFVRRERAAHSPVEFGEDGSDGLSSLAV